MGLDLTIPHEMRKRWIVAKRKSVELQLEHLIKLLTLWPTCSINNAKKFLFQTYAMKMGRATWQEARKRVGLTIPQYTENTKKKRAFVRLSASLIIADKGIDSPQKVRRMVRTKVVEQFQEDLNTILLNSWVDDVIKEVIEGANIEDIAADARADCYEFTIKAHSSGKQQELL